MMPKDGRLAWLDICERLSPLGPSGAFVTIRGRRIDFSQMVASRLFDPAYRAKLRSDLLNAKPFPHLVTDSWFDKVLLELVHEEFDLYRREKWKGLRDDRQLHYRSTRQTRFDEMGPASHLYFSLVNSGWFVALLEEITGVDDLIADPELAGGGLHETREGGKFAFHRDFDRHIRHGFSNQMVFITYLNKDWQESWKGALELRGLDGSTSEVIPELGRSILMMQGPDSYHGHPAPMAAPAGKTRRSVATYYYKNRLAARQRAKRVGSVFLNEPASWRLKRAAVHMLPPVATLMLRRMLSRYKARRTNG